MPLTAGSDQFAAGGPGPHVDRQLELDRLHDRQVGGLGALENVADIDTGLTIGIPVAGAVADQAAGRDELARAVDRWDPVRGICRPRMITSKSRDKLQQGGTQPFGCQ